MSSRGEGRSYGGARRGQPRSGGGGASGGRGRERGSYASYQTSSSRAPVSEPMEVHELVVPPQPRPPVSAKAATNPPRPGFGRIGRKTMIVANHFLVTVADNDLHHYDVSISPEVTSKKVCREIINQLVKCYQASHLSKRHLAYDGRKSCYTAGALPFTSKDFIVKLDDEGARRDREFRVTLKFAARADLQHLNDFLRGRQLDVPHETIQALDVVLRHRPSNNYQVVGRSFFAPQLGEYGKLGDGLEYWKGFYQSLRPTQMGLSLNIDMSARGFYDAILVSDYICHYLNKDVTSALIDQERLKLRRVLKGLRVEVKYPDSCRRYRITGLSIEQPHQLMFKLDESGTMVSVAQYFREKYNMHMKYPFLPAVKCGSDTKPIYIPMEFCKILPGQRYTRKLNEKQVTALLRATCQRPHERERSIKSMVSQNNYNRDSIVSAFGMQVRPDLTQVEARVLPPPTIMYHESGRESLVQPRIGVWNMIDKRMVAGASVGIWTCINFSRLPQPKVEMFCRELIDMCCQKGMVFNPKPVVPYRQVMPSQIERGLADIHNASMKAAGQLQLLIIILPEVSGSYGRIKRVCETELGIVSQCCQPRQASKLSKQYMENVAMKMNVKAGGRNSVLELAHSKRIPLLSDLPTIILGADVTHPSPGEDTSPSIAAVVGSMDWPFVTKYRALVSGQPHREEIIQDLYRSVQDPKVGVVHSGMIRDHLMAFYRTTKAKPSRIIFYRDGVSEGQFTQVLLHEMDAIRKACGSLEEGYLPPVTFVVVQKRHHTRFFPAKHGDRNETDKSGNVLPGTVVDTRICHPIEFDFYLCSHSGIQGTSRPAHYHVLYDENGFTADCLQTLTNNLCYTYARCTRSVSIVPPAYYAHLAAFRARAYLEGVDATDGESSAGEGSGGARRGNAAVRPLPVIRDNVKEVMFYC